MNLSADQRFDWLRLIRTEGVGPKTFRTLINRFGSASAALEGLPDLLRRAGRAPVVVTSRQEAEAELRRAERLGVRFVASGEADYPADLLSADPAPPLIAVRGGGSVLSRPMVAIVGSRNASAAGRRFTQTLARDLATEGFTIVSGLARGIDAAAHQASLSEGTIAVLAGGHERVYPSEHEPLLEQIVAAGGAAISEMPLTWEPRARDFPRRNRIVAGLSRAIVVVEAARRSGSLITARFGADLNREVFAVPGFPTDPRSEGTNDLLAGGAIICRDARDVVDALAPILGHRPAPVATFKDAHRDAQEHLWDELDLDGASADHDLQLPTAPIAGQPELWSCDQDQDQSVETRLLELLSQAPVGVDELTRCLNIPARDVQELVIGLEIQGRLARLPGGLVTSAV